MTETTIPECFRSQKRASSQLLSACLLLKPTEKYLYSKDEGPLAREEILRFST